MSPSFSVELFQSWKNRRRAYTLIPPETFMDSLRRSGLLFAFVGFILTAQAAWAADVRFKITLPAGYPQAMTGRVFVIISKTDAPEPRLQVGSWRSHVEFLGRDVAGLQPGEATTMDALVLGYPLRSVRELPAGDYYVQALLNVYT